MTGFIDWYISTISANPSARIVFATEIFIAELIFMLPYKRRKHFAPRVGFAMLAYIVIGFFFPENWINFGSLVTLPIFCVSVLLHIFCSAYPVKKVIFNCIGAYALQNIAINIGVCVRSIFPATEAYRIPVDFAIAAVIFPFGWRCFARCNRNKDINFNNIWLMVLTVAVILSVDLLAKFASLHNVGENVALRVSMTFTDVVALALMYFSADKAKIKTENIQLETMLYFEQKQYDLLSEAIDVINVKVHDLKYLLTMLDEGDHNQAERLENIKETVVFYESIAKTGNKSLDSILTQKLIYCREQNIIFTYTVDSTHLDKIQRLDMWTLFNNALDNAIESVMREEDTGKRIILLKIFTRNGMLCIHLENYCSFPIVFENGLPVTSKKEGGHGFGSLSMRYFAKKYNGNATFSLNSDMFCLDIIIPVEE